MWGIETRTSLSGFMDLEKEWDALLNKCSGKLLFMTFDYLASWLIYIAPYIGTGNLIVLLVRDPHSNELVAACPLIFSRRNMSWVIPGWGLWGYTDIICPEKLKMEMIPSLLKLMGSRSRREHGVKMGPFCYPSLTMCICAGYVKLKYSPQRYLEDPPFRTDADAPFIGVSGGLDSYITYIKHKKATYDDTMRQGRRLHELGNLEVKRLSDNSDEVSKYLALFFEMYNRQRPDSKFLKTPFYSRFYTDFALRASKKGFLDFTWLSLNDVPIAFHYGFVHKDCLYYFTPTFDIDYRQYSPGKVLMWELIKRCFEQNMEFDFMNNPEPYKEDWSNAMRLRRWVDIDGEVLEVAHGPNG